ncbi:hypothetical protein M9H77_31075 [Catharanthus roseus]|uniref:Uncharacterized protein n=1 Tax=Catharanthus roseus TaxID=4058 RepID=A0ACC0A3B5_CATRO|nr:hypothetical protein M9H77_31075 [Catharanthus roseus]
MDENLKAQVTDLQAKATFFIDAERKFLAQKTKGEFLLKGDKSTKLFHSLVKRNAKKNFIAALTNEDGTSTTSLNEVQEEFLMYYGNLLGTRQDVRVPLGLPWTVYRTGLKRTPFRQQRHKYFTPARLKQSWAKITWNPTFPPKFSFIMWLTILGRLPTMDNLKFLEVDITCNLCKQNEETLSHLFFACPFTGTTLLARLKYRTDLRRNPFEEREYDMSMNKDFTTRATSLKEEMKESKRSF